jgi:TP901 family phage tail tape measure protein
MADETIVNRLGFSVEDALRELQRLDSALQSSGTAFQTFGERINAWNSQSDAALSRMKDMASAASRLANSMAKMGNGAATPAAPAAAAPASKLWLPSDVSEEIQKANQNMTNLGDTATRAGEKMRQAGEHGKKAGHDAGEAAKKAHEHTKDWTVTWETLTRVVMTQAIVRALSQIRDLLRESVDEALKFSTKISEIQTIAPRIDRNFQGLSKEIANMAREFNFPLPDVAEATYQTISDQFTTAAQRADIMTAAAKLARVGVMDLNEAAQLLTGTLNAYGMASSQADIVAAKFFQTVNLGRVRGAELTPIIGRIVPIANELGVSLDEVNSSMAALTISSMKPAEAATAFRSALSALIKPSEQMQKEMAALGYATPQLAVKAEGLQGIFLKLKDTTDENVAAMAKLFLNIRGLNAEARLTGEGAEKVAEAMKAMTDPNLTDSFNEMVKVFTSTDAQQYTKELNKFQVTLATEVGPELVKFLKTLLDAAGGADGLASAIKSIATSLTSLAELLAPVGGLLALFSLRGKLAGMAGFKGVVFNNVVAPLTMAAWTVDYLDSQMASMLDNANAKFRKDVEEIVAAQKKAAQTRLDAEMKVYDEAGRRLAQYAAEVRRALNVQVEQTRKANEELVVSSRTTMQAMITAREKVVQQFRAAAQDANKAAEDSMKRQADAQAKLDDLLFKRRLEERQKYDDYFKKPEVTSDMYGRRALELAQQAASLLAKAETPDQERTAQAIFQRAAAYAQEAEQIAKGTENEWLRKRAADTVEDIIRKQIAAEKELQANSAQRASAAARAAAHEQERVDRMKVLMKGILEDLDLFDKKGQKEPKVTAALSEDLKVKMAEFKKQWMEGTANLNLDEALKFDDLQRRVKTALEGGVSEAEVQKLFAAPKTIDDFRAQIEAGLNKKAVDIAILMPVASPELAKKLLAEMPLPDRDKYIQQQNTAYEKQSELVKKLEGEQQTLTDGTTRQKAAVGSLAANMEIYQKGLEGLPFWMNAAAKAKGAILGGGDIQKETKALADLIAQFRQLSQTGGKGFGLTEYEELQKKATAVLASPTTTGWDQSFITNQMANLKFLAEQAEAMKKLQTPQGQPRDLEAELLKARQEAERLRELIDKLRPQAATEMGQGAQAAQNALSAIPSMAGLAGDIQEAATAMWDLAAASWSVQSPPPITAAKGRTVWNFLAFGGPAQGTDVIPAMLSPGEVVINAASARRFAAQLTAINAGVQPVYRSEGGSVTNIGDINVNVTGGGTSRQTAREIAAEIRRELRRGTATL